MVSSDCLAKCSIKGRKTFSSSPDASQSQTVILISKNSFLVIWVNSSPDLYRLFLFIVSFALVLQSHIGKAHTLTDIRVCPKATFTQGRLFVSFIVTQIGRWNNTHAEIYMCIRRGEHSSPLRCSENILVGRNVSRRFFYCAQSSNWGTRMENRLSQASSKSAS